MARAQARAAGTRPLAGLACAPSAAHWLRRDVQKSAPGMPTTAAGLTQPRFLPDGCCRVMRASTGAHTQFSGQIYLGCTCSGRHPNGAVPRSFVGSIATSSARWSASAPRSTSCAGGRTETVTTLEQPVLDPSNSRCWIRADTRPLSRPLTCGNCHVVHDLHHLRGHVRNSEDDHRPGGHGPRC